MAIETKCDGCGKLLSVGDEHAGRRARCPACGQIYTIPSPNSAPPDLPTPPTPQSSSNQLFAETTAGAIPNPPSSQQSAENADQFWMRSTEGSDYGPVDRVTLNRWFNEGRVGPGYMIRQSETGDWQVAESFKPRAIQAGMPSSGNPYATATTGSVVPAYGQMYPKPDQSGLVLAFGILSWFICPIFGIVAWVMGSSGLRDIKLGLVDPANKGLMQAGYYLGMVNVILYVLCGGGYFVFIAMMILLGAMG
jgi:phage FluMu protein Com